MVSEMSTLRNKSQKIKTTSIDNSVSHCTVAMPFSHVSDEHWKDGIPLYLIQA